MSRRSGQRDLSKTPPAGPALFKCWAPCEPLGGGISSRRPDTLPNVRVISIPIYGAIPAGQPIDATQEQEGCVLMDVETLGIKPTARTFRFASQGRFHDRQKYC